MLIASENNFLNFQGNFKHCRVTEYRAGGSVKIEALMASIFFGWGEELES